MAFTDTPGETGTGRIGGSRVIIYTYIRSLMYTVYTDLIGDVYVMVNRPSYQL